MIGKIVFGFVVLVLAINCASIEKSAMTEMVVDGQSGLDERLNNMTTVLENSGDNNQHTRHKRCLHDLFARLMVRLCSRSGCENSAPTERPARRHRVEWHSQYQSSWGNQQQAQQPQPQKKQPKQKPRQKQRQKPQQKQQQEEERKQRQEEEWKLQQEEEQQQEEKEQLEEEEQPEPQSQRSDISPSEAQNNEEIEDSHTSDTESENNTVNGGDDDEIEEEEAGLMEGLKQFEHEYDRQLDVEMKLAKQTGEVTNSRKMQRLAKNKQYTALKRKILSIPKRKKRIRLLRQLTTSFRNVIRVQKRISEGKKARIRAEARKKLTKPRRH